MNKKSVNLDKSNSKNRMIKDIIDNDNADECLYNHYYDIIWLSKIYCFC